jgi:hypothetical protein
MTETRSTGQEIQTEVLGAVRKTEQMLTNAITVWADTVQSITPLMASAYDFTEQMLISQRKFTDGLLEATRSQRKFTDSLLRATRSQQKFTEGMIEATKPLLAAGNGTTAKRGATK